MTLTPVQQASLLKIATTDGRFQASERARAAFLLDSLPPSRRETVVGLTTGPFLTPAGVEVVRKMLPTPDPAQFGHAVVDLLRRIRARTGHACSGVRAERSEDGTWTVTWQGDGFHQFSRKGSDKALADKARADLLISALALGLVGASEGDDRAVFSLREAEFSDAGEDDSELFLPPSKRGTTLDRLIALWDQMEIRDAQTTASVRRSLSHLPLRRVMSASEVDDVLRQVDREEALQELEAVRSRRERPSQVAA